MPALNFISDELTALKEDALLRSLRTIDTPADRIIKIDGKEYLNFSSNNYLGLASHPDVIKAVQDGAARWGTGAGASRLISGTMEIHTRLEQELAAFKGTEACLVFPTGFAANLGVITSLVEKEDAIIIDRLDHASIIDACKLSGAKLLVYPHRDVKKLAEILKRQRDKYRRVLICTDSLFSMDGDIAPLPEIVTLAKKFDAMTMVDEAHATGVMGNEGRGVVEHFHLEDQIDVIMGTLSKAFGVQGGFVCGSRKLIDYLINKARSFIYSTALAPCLAAGALKALALIRTRPELREQLWKNTNYLKEALLVKKLDIGDSESPIIPIMINDKFQMPNVKFKNSSEAALALSRKLFDAGLYIPAIRYPTVGKDEARLRVSVMATHTEDDLHRLVRELAR
jgi:8-amino-7-oxononanoate synthase